MSNNKRSGAFGKGYYIALVLCAAAIGITSYVYYRNSNTPEQTLQGSENQAVISTEPDVAALATQPPASTPTQSPTEPTKKPLKTGAPLSGQTVAEFAMDCLSYNQTTRDWRTHDGLDIAAPAGTAVCAAADGTVYTTFTDDAYGTTVVIRHQDGYTTTYASLAPELQVAPGDQVSLGQTIGCVGTTALLESALEPHVHFSVTCNDQAMDPAEFLALGGE